MMLRSNPRSGSLNTTGVFESESDPAQLLPDLLDQLIVLGEKAKELKQALGSNGHRAEKLAEIKELLQQQANK